MKTLKLYINEALHVNKNMKMPHNYHPKTNDELNKLVRKLIKERGNNANLNDIDTSEIIDMSHMFEYSYFNGDISEWDVSSVKDMRSTFDNCPLKKNPPKWYKKQ